MENEARKTIKKRWRNVFFSLLALLLLPVLLSLALLVPPVQQWVVQKATVMIGAYLNTEIQIESIYLQPIKTLHINGLLIKDQRQDTLLFAESLRLNLSAIEEKNKKVMIKKVEIKDTYFNLYKSAEGEKLNLQFILDAFSSADSSTSSSNWQIWCEHLVLNGLRFKYNDFSKPLPIDEAVDFNHIDVNHLYGSIRTIAIGEEVTAKLNGLHFIERSGLQLRCLNSEVSLVDTAIALTRMDLITNRSALSGDFKMEFDDWDGFNHFNSEVFMNAQLVESFLHFNDIAYFAPKLKYFMTPVHFTLDVNGTLEKLNANIDSLHFGNSAELIGTIKLRGLPDPDNLQIDARIAKLALDAGDIESLGIPNEQGVVFLSLPKEVHALGKMVYNGQIMGFLNDFISYGNIQTNAGNLRTDINLKLEEEIIYSGRIASSGLNLSFLSTGNNLGYSAFDLQVNGIGFDPNTLQLDALGNLSFIEWNNYNYQNITLDGHMKDKHIEGNLSIDDPNGRIDFTGNIDLNQNIPYITSIIRVGHLKTGALKLIPQDTFGDFSGSVYLNMMGSALNEIEGELKVLDFIYENETQKINLDSIVIRDKKLENGHRITVNTDVSKLKMEGKTSVLQVHEAFLAVIGHYAPELIANQQERLGEVDQAFDIDFHLDKLPELFALLDPDLQVNGPIDLRGNVNTVNNSFELNLAPVSWRLGEIVAQNMRVTLSPIQEKLTARVDIERFSLAKDYFLEQMNITSGLKNDSLFTRVDWSNQTAMADSGHIEILAFEAKNHRFNVELNDLYARIAGVTWESFQKAKLQADTSSFVISNLDLRSPIGSVVCSGSLTGASNDRLRLKVEDFNLEYLSNFGLNSNELQGFFTGNMLLSKVDETLLANTQIEINNLIIDGIEVGDIEGFTNYKSEDKSINVQLDLDYLGERNIVLSGNVFPFKEANQLDLIMTMNGFRSALLEPFIGAYMSNLDGEINGDLDISGTLKGPVIKGDLVLTAFSGKVEYLNTLYKIPSAKIAFDKGFIGIDHAPIYDEKGQRANLTATIFHDNFKDLSYDVFVDANNFLALNTSLAQNEDYYGSANITGNVGISGYEGLTNIVVDASTGPATRLSIPLTSSDEVGELDFIRFIPPPDDKVILNRDESFENELNKLLLDFQLSVNDQAEMQIIFDEKIGDVIKVKGNGDILMNIDNRGTFNMFGDYTMSSGDYLFTLQNVVNKRFAVRPGSKISWNGAPTDAIVDLTAVYSLRAAPINLTSSVGDTSEVYQKRMPVNVYLNMKGALLEPTITFDVDLPSLPESDIANQLLDPKTTSDQDMNQQVFALLLTSNFFSQGSGVSALSGAGQSTTYEMVSNQFSNWISQYFENVDIGVQVGNQTELNLSTELLNDRVLVELNGSVQGDEQSAQTNSNFAGEFNIEYKINRDGSLRARVFNEANNYNPTNLNQSPYTQGLGMFYRREFDTFGGLIKSLFKAKKKPVDN